MARRHDMNTNLLFEWRQKYRDGTLGQGKPAPGLIRIGVIEQDGSLGPLPGTCSTPPVAPPCPESPVAPERRVASLSGIIEIELPNRAKVRVDAGIDPATLRRLLTVIREPA